MALENANSILFEFKQGGFFNYEAVVLKTSARRHILLFEINTSFAIFQRFLALRFISGCASFYIKILILGKLFGGKKRIYLPQGNSYFTGN